MAWTLLISRDDDIAGAGSWYGKGGSKTLAHPDFDCITRWWHPWENGGSGPAAFTQGSNKRVWLQCDGCPRCGEVHEWDARVVDLTRLTAAGSKMCPFCDSRSSLGRFCSCRSIAADSRLLEEWHLDDPESATVAQASVLQKYKWRCTAGRGHTDYKATPAHRSTNGSGCPACAAERQGKLNHGSLAEQIPDLAAEWDAARNGGPPGQLTCGSNGRAWWRCSQCRHSWQAKMLRGGIVCPFYESRGTKNIAAAAPSQQTAGFWRSGTRTTQTLPQSLRAVPRRSTNGDAQQAGAMQTMRSRQPVAAHLALAVLLALQSAMGEADMAAWQSSGLTWQQNEMLLGMEGRQAS